jgi:TolB protein
MKQVVAILLGLLLLGVALAQSDTSARIAFVTPQGQLAVVDNDGDNLQVLTGGQQRFQFPAWSPDGTSLAAIASDLQGGTVQLVRFEAEENLPVELYRSDSQPPFYLYWSPDSQIVSFLANHPSDGIALHLVAVESRADRVLTTGQPFYWQWSADSSRLLLHTGFSGVGSRLGFSDVASDSLLENLASPGFFQSPAISASGRFIAYGSVRVDGQGQVVLQSNPEAGPEEAVERRLLHQGIVAMSWSPTEEILAIMSPDREVRRFFGSIDLIDAETGLLEPLIDELALAFFWSPDGRFIAYITPVGSEGGDIASLDQTAHINQTQVQQIPLLFELAIVEVATRERRSLTTFVPTPMFVQQFLPFFDQYALSHHVWSPVSDALVLPMLDDQRRPQVVIVSLDGSVTPIAGGDTPFWNQR